MPSGIMKTRLGHKARGTAALGCGDWGRPRERKRNHSPAWAGLCHIWATILLAAILMAASSWAAEGPDVQVRSKVDRSVITVGDPIQYTFTVSWAEGIAVTPPSLGANLGQFEIQDYKAGKAQKVGRRNEIVTTYRVTLWETGQFDIPGVDVAYKDASGQQRTVRSEPIGIQVESVLSDQEGKPRDIKGQAVIPVNPYPYIIGASAAVGLVLIVLAIYLLVRRYKTKRALSLALAPKAPADELALQRLAELRAKDLASQGRLDEYYLELSDIVREYVENRYSLAAREWTTEQTLDHAASLALGDSLLLSLSRLLETSDLVKFAKHEPTAPIHDSLCEEARVFVEATRPALAAQAVQATAEGAA